MKKLEYEHPRMPLYMSPTSVSKFFSDRDEYYLNYLALDKPPRMPQTEPMSVGSAFDAYAKAHLYKHLYGNFGPGDEFKFEVIFEQQVAEPRRDFALAAGKNCWEQYVFSGALADMVAIMEKSTSDPRFEFTVSGTIEGEHREVPLLGKPDIYFTLVDDDGVTVHVIIDWKVNGYCARTAVSPTAGYTMCRDGWKGDHSRSHNRVHKDAILSNIAGCPVNLNKPMEAVNESWAAQVSTYAWLLGVPVGNKFIAGIDQLACGPHDSGRRVRVAQHRNIVGQNYQHEAMNRYCEAWGIIHSDHLFRDMSLEASQARCEMLDGRASALRGEGTDDDLSFASMTR